MKELKDYLHLYLGCEVKTHYGRGLLRGVDKNGSVMISYFNKNFTPDEDYMTNDKASNIGNITIQLILRPLSDMTEDEKRECVEIVYEYSIKWSSKESWLNQFDELVFPVNDNFIHKDLLLHLLSKHFDLFGLIESGLAIDATTLKTHHVKQ